MRMCRLLMAIVLLSSTPLVFADNNHAKHAPSDSKEKVIAVGNEKAAASGAKDETKTIREAESHAAKPSGTREHDIDVGNEKAAGHGSKAEAKSVKPAKNHAYKGKHKAKGHDKKTNQTTE